MPSTLAPAPAIVTDAEKLRALLDSMRAEDETLEDAVIKLARHVSRSPRTIWRWLGGDRIPRSARQNLFKRDD